MRAYSTSDISLNDLRELSSELGPDLQIHIDESQMFYKGGIPPSWVVFFAQPNWLMQMLELSVGLYVAEIIKEAGKDTWENRSRQRREIALGNSPQRSASCAVMSVPELAFGASSSR